MVESNTGATQRFSPRAGLAALGIRLRGLDLFGPVRRTVQIAQKTVRHAPAQKLYDAFIMMVAGGYGLVEINTRLRSDPALQAAFGRAGCAEQSVVQETLDACTAENVAQLNRPWTRCIGGIAAAIGMTMPPPGRCWRPTRAGCPAAPRRPAPPRATSPSSAIGAAASWAAWWRVGTTR